jgi:hypothetical protein
MKLEVFMSSNAQWLFNAFVARDVSFEMGIELILNPGNLQGKSRRTGEDCGRNHRLQKRPSPNHSISKPVFVYIFKVCIYFFISVLSSPPKICGTD